MLLSTAYFPPIEYFALLARSPLVHIEACEHYKKQSWRNRCRILTSTGCEYLNVPVVHGDDLYKTLITEVAVDYSVPWVARTQRAIQTAYSSSAFFEYYRDSLFSILDSKPRRLWDLNLEIISFFCSKIGIAPEIVPTADFERGEAEDDYRELIHPKRPNSILDEIGADCNYYQLFPCQEKSLSIMDLLFNEGPESLCCIKSF